MSDRIIPFPFEELQRRRAERAGKLSEHPQTASALLPSQAEEKNPDTDAADAAFSRPGGLLPHGPIFRPLASEGQSPSWNMRLGSGLGMTCSRNPLFPDPEEEAARIIGRAIRYGRKCARYQIPIPRGTLRRLAAVLAVLAGESGVAVGGDTGPLRLAAAVGMRTVGLFGPTLALRYGMAAPVAVELQGLTCCPHRRPTAITEQPCWWTARCPLSPAGPACMADIPVDDVTRAVLRLTETTPTAAPAPR